ncbi:amidophosphoribosyltransferase [Uliginosibacterium sp. 31-12]|uniref:amidophosphoribosyltransferase n=1 Tax=Uliginosibacterium sp. 31-12 TaxID=3062781 RepID=UPI0026E13CE0|nr:amidophosphoribosyltransferase [Uliginosibacterium sp. 31-12]MDO6385146.1 amidophosphoribosyltransferase [Uliginosibacterium sp. 31-12]
MCGIIGVMAKGPVNQLLYDGLLVLQHRGQDAAGIATTESGRFHMHKGSGLVSEVFRTRNMRNLEGNWGIGHCRYPTAGSAFNAAEAQPFYVNSPFGLMLAHNGNLTNSDELKREMYLGDLRHMNTNSDSEVLLNVLAHELQVASNGAFRLDEDTIFTAVAGTHKRAKGAYAAVVMIAGYGLLAFRDPHGIRPLILGAHETPEGTEYMVASESVAMDVLGFKTVRDIAPGEAVLIDTHGKLSTRQCADMRSFAPCMFEYVYLARPDSIIDGISVYESRVKMGVYLAEKIKREYSHLKIDVVIPIPDSSRSAAMELASHLGVSYREGFVKNRYIGRTFIMPGQAVRKKSVRQKLNAMHQEFVGKNVLLVDDSIVRGTTSREIINMAREAGATKVFMASAAPPVRHANVYGIDMPSKNELIAAFRDADQVGKEIGADAMIYQDLEDLKKAVGDLNPAIEQFECSCFDGVYVTGDVTSAYLDSVEGGRGAASKATDDDAEQLDLNLMAGASN